jgi:hypothetical protein
MRFTARVAIKPTGDTTKISLATFVVFLFTASGGLCAEDTPQPLYPQYPMRGLVSFDAGNEFILATPFDQLDTPEAANRYAQIFKEPLQRYPAANFSFGGY